MVESFNARKMTDVIQFANLPQILNRREISPEIWKKKKNNPEGYNADVAAQEYLLTICESTRLALEDVFYALTDNVVGQGNEKKRKN